MQQLEVAWASNSQGEEYFVKSTRLKPSIVLLIISLHEKYQIVWNDN